MLHEAPRDASRKLTTPVRHTGRSGNEYGFRSPRTILGFFKDGEEVKLPCFPFAAIRDGSSHYMRLLLRHG